MSTHSYQAQPILDTPILGQVVEGCVLGDATIRRITGAHNTTNFFRMGQCTKGTDFLILVSRILTEHNVVVKMDLYHDRSAVDIRTASDIYWSGVRDRFYPNGVKVIPGDYSPTPVSLLFFYLSDGCFMPREKYSKYYGKQYQCITGESEWCYFATYPYEWSSVENLRDKISQHMDAVGVIYKQRQNGKELPRLVFRGSECHKLLKVIGLRDLIPASMEYKFPLNTR